MPANLSGSYVLIVEDHPLVADSVTACVRLACSNVVIRLAETLRIALDIVKQHSQPRLIITDLTLMDAYGIEAVIALRDAAPDSPALVVTALDDPGLREDAIRQGIAGYLVKSASTNILRECIAELLGEQRSGKPAPPAPSLPPSGELTRKQRQVLDELAAGRSNREIAVRLNIAPDTVGSHMKEIFARLGAKNRTEAVVRYLQITGQHSGKPQ